MPSLHTSWLFAVCLSSFLILTSCSSSANTNSSQTVTQSPAANAKTNAEELRVYVSIPQETEDIVWREYPTEKKLVAVLLFSREDADEVLRLAAGSGPPKKVKIPVEGWFPVEIVAQGDASGDGTVAADAYPATAILLEPYVNGTIARVENTDYFVLEAFSR